MFFFQGGFECFLKKKKRKKVKNFYLNWEALKEEEDERKFVKLGVADDIVGLLRIESFGIRGLLLVWKAEEELKEEVVADDDEDDEAGIELLVKLDVTCEDWALILFKIVFKCFSLRFFFISMQDGQYHLPRGAELKPIQLKWNHCLSH